MFDGVPEQFHQFITPRTSLPLHLPFPLHASGTPNNTTTTTTTTTTFPTNFDPYNPSHQLPLQPNLLHHPLHHSHKDEEKEENRTLPMNLEIQQRDQTQQQLPELIDTWTNDEVLALLRIRSSMENWFPELTWEHVSRKLAELGYKRSAEKCKEKFEEESRYFSNINYCKNNNNNISNYRFLSELEELYQSGDHHHQVGTEEKTQDKMGGHHAVEQEEDSRNVEAKQKEQSQEVVEKISKERKRKRPDRFEMFKGFCESIVHKMMAQQEEMHNKLLQDMMKRDEEKFTREEAWKKQEMDKMNKELEMMAREQAIAGDRQANIIQILNRFSPTSPASLTLNPNPNPITQNPNNSSSIPNHHPSQNINPSLPSTQNPSSTPAQDKDTLHAPNNPSSSSLNTPLETNSVLNKGSSNSNAVSTNEKDDVGRRWPKDEVLALINLRCNSVNNNNEEKEGNKAPLWERISQGMLELGYKRSAKRCKEKWENINKYFRKTKDSNKKRSIDSRTCPYFHQLSNLYNQGKLVLQSERLESQLNPQTEQVPPDQTQLADDSSSRVGSGGFSTVQQEQVDHGGEKALMQVPSLDFDHF